MKNFTVAALLATTPLTLNAGGVSAPVVEVVSVPSPSPVNSSEAWQGFYVGVQAGNYDLTIENQPDEEYGLSRNGVHAGYMHDLGNLIVGAEVAYGILNFNEESDEIAFTEARIMARAGYDMGKFLPYVTAGMGALFIEDGVGSNVYKETVTGPVVGAGAAYMISDSFIVGAQYLRSSYLDEGGRLFRDGATFDELAVRASYKF